MITGYFRILCLRGVLALALPVLPLAGSAAPADEQALIGQLRTNYMAMVSAEHEYRTQRESGLLNSREAADYAAYVARLHRIVAEDCRSVMEAGLGVPRGIVCPAVQAMPMAADIDLVAERTRVEKTGDLDARLMAELGDFDEMLLREQERVKASAPRTDTGAGGGAGGGGVTGTSGDAAADGATGSAGEGAQSASQGSGARASGSGAAGSSQSRGATAPGSWNKSGGTGGQPEDIPDGSDDDVVARQLREAAEKETDPELKEKLWEEYRRYKQGTR